MSNSSKIEYAYIKDIAPIADVPIMGETKAWDDPVAGQTYMLVANEGLYYENNAYDKTRNCELSIELDQSVKVQMRTQGTKNLI